MQLLSYGILPSVTQPCTLMRRILSANLALTLNLSLWEMPFPPPSCSVGGEKKCETRSVAMLPGRARDCAGPIAWPRQWRCSRAEGWQTHLDQQLVLGEGEGGQAAGQVLIWELGQLPQLSVRQHIACRVRRLVSKVKQRHAKNYSPQQRVSHARYLSRPYGCCNRTATQPLPPATQPLPLTVVER